MELELQQNVEHIRNICGLIENNQEYIAEMIEYLPTLKTTVNNILMCAQRPDAPLEINQQFVLQVLQDIVYGIEFKDPVILLDVLKYGLLEIYYYVMEELQVEG